MTILKEELRNCPVCNSGHFVTLKEKPRWTPCRVIRDETGYRFHMRDVICTDCGMIYKNPMLTTDSMRDFYNGMYAELFKENLQAGISKVAINDNILTTIYTLDFLSSISFPLKGKKVFEVGTGMGLLLKGMEGEGAIVDGIDLDARSIELGNKLFGYNFKHISFDCLDDYTSPKYDLIVCNNSLEHFYNPAWVLDKFHSMLSPGGSILLELPDARYPYPATLSDAFLSSAHNHTFVHETITPLLNSLGFQVDYLRNAGHKKCMFILASPSVKAMNYSTVKLDPMNLKDELLSLYQEIDLQNVHNAKIGKELSDGIYVNIGIDRTKTESPRTYNVRNLALANMFLENGRTLDALSFLKEYGAGQPEDANCCYGSFLYLRAMCHRQLGDFVLAKKLLTECATHYPNIRKYNFVKDLEIDGLVSNTVFSNYLWWNAEKILQDFG